MSLQQFKRDYNLFSNHDNLGQALASVKPSGSTCLRDSVALGIQLIFKMYSELEEKYKVNDRTFLHIIITDGEDCGSKQKVEDLAVLMLLIREHSHIIMNHFIGIDFSANSKDAKELAVLSALGGDTSEIHLAQTAKIEDIFNRIKMQCGIITQTRMQAVGNEDIGIVRVQQQQQQFIQISVRKFVVVFNLDISGSMSGSRWQKVCQCVSRFTSALTPEDLVSVILFNDKCQFLQPLTIQIQVEYKPPAQTSAARGSSYYSSNLVEDNRPLVKKNTNEQVENDGYCHSYCTIF